MLLLLLQATSDRRKGYGGVRVQGRRACGVSAARLRARQQKATGVRRERCARHAATAAVRVRRERCAPKGAAAALGVQRLRGASACGVSYARVLLMTMMVVLWYYYMVTAGETSRAVSACASEAVSGMWGSTLLDCPASAPHVNSHSFTQQCPFN